MINNLKIIIKKNKFVAISLALHLLFIVVAIVGLPFFSKPKMEERIITVQMLPVSDISNVKTQKAQKEKVVKSKKAKKTQKSIQPKKSSPAKEKPKKQKKSKQKTIKKDQQKPKKKEKAKSTIQAPKKKDSTAPKTEKKKVTSKKESATTTKPKVPPKKKVAKKPAKKQELKAVKKKTDDMDALLRTLEQSSDGKNPKSSKYNREQKNDLEHDVFGNLDESLPLSISEINLIKEQIRSQWNTSMVAGVRNADQVVITLSLSFEIDGEVRAAKIISMQCPGIDNITCQAVADSAVRATHLASPLDGLPPDRYDVWKELNFAFTPVD